MSFDVEAAITPNDCIRCGHALVTEEDLKTGICAECWTVDDFDPDLDEDF
tara:strand:- start:1584 stop:1733 length:150 start_codon:yes stop_codon:yes gene_type:complete